MMPPPPVLPPSATGDELVNVPYDSMAEQPFKSPAYLQKMKAFTGASDSAHTPHPNTATVAT